MPKNCEYDLLIFQFFDVFELQKLKLVGFQQKHIHRSHKKLYMSELLFFKNNQQYLLDGLVSKNPNLLFDLLPPCIPH